MTLIPNDVARLAITIIFAIVLGVMGILAFIKILFGAIVYHTERIASKLPPQTKPEIKNQ